MKSAYDQAAASGRYEGRGGVLGKYDNVRLHWEEACFHRHLAALMRRDGDDPAGVRICDLGCGGGDGLALIRAAAEDDHRDVARYTGVDLVDSLLEQARQRFADDPVVQFVQGDLAAGLPGSIEDDPYELYFASFGTLSHLDTAATVRLLTDIARHGTDGSLVVGDWLGRFSYEWQDLWHEDVSQERWMDYRISYIYEPEERKRHHIDSFPLRLVAPQEVATMVAAAEQASGRHFEMVTLEDRSLLCGRHIDTGEYNGNPLPLRSQLNHLHEPGVRADLARLRVELPPRSGFERHSQFFATLARRWNALVDAATRRLAGQHVADAASDDTVLAPGIARLKAAVDDPDAIEQALALALRDLEVALQTGSGNGHGLVAVFRLHT